MRRYSLDDEDFYSGDREEVKQDAREKGQAHYFECEFRQCGPGEFLVAQHCLEYADESLYNAVGEVADSEYTDVSEEAKKELADFLREWELKWITPGRLSHYWVSVGPSIKVEITE